MRVIDLIRGEKPCLSFEVFPPKTSANYQSIQEATEKIAALGPDFISVTYGAGGGTSDYTVSISAHLQEKYHVPILAHLSCINSSHEGVKKQLDAMRAAGIENVLALRGGRRGGQAPGWQLVLSLRQRADQGDEKLRRFLYRRGMLSGKPSGIQKSGGRHCAPARKSRRRL